MSWFSKPKPPRLDLFQQQLAFENEGAIARIAGLTEADCPYKEPGSSEQNPQEGVARLFWINGWREAERERQIIRQGYKAFWTSTGEYGGFSSWDEYQKAMDSAPIYPAETAVAQGWWKPRYFSSSDFTTIRKSSS